MRRLKRSERDRFLFAGFCLSVPGPKHNEMDYDADCPRDQKKPEIRPEILRGSILDAVDNEKISPCSDIED
jgi:hypothetical protein